MTQKVGYDLNSNSLINTRHFVYKDQFDGI